MNEMRELTDMEVEAVAGGLFDFGNVNIQPNIGLQVGVATGGFRSSVTAEAPAWDSCWVRPAWAPSPKSRTPARSSAAPGGVRVLIQGPGLESSRPPLIRAVDRYAGSR